MLLTGSSRLLVGLACVRVGGWGDKEGSHQPGVLATAANGLGDMEEAGEGTSVIPWLVGVTPVGTGLFGELALGVAEGTGLEVGAVAAAAGMSYFCNCSR